MSPPALYDKSKSLGSGGSMVARLKLKGIDGSTTHILNAGLLTKLQCFPALGHLEHRGCCKLLLHLSRALPDQSTHYQLPHFCQP